MFNQGGSNSSTHLKVGGFLASFVYDFMVNRKKLSIVYSKDYHMGLSDLDYECVKRRFYSGY